jgi:hypothetical protein
LLQNEGRQQEYLEPDLDHLVSLMLKAVEDEAWRQQAARLGVTHMQAHYSWGQVTDRLCQILF